MSSMMRAWVVATPGPIDTKPLEFIERPVPVPGPREVRLRVLACGVCRTDLHLAEGDLVPHRPRVVPGHEIVAVIDGMGPDSTEFRVGERVGAAWLARTCGVCRFCLSQRENLCLEPTFTGWDVDGGYATFVVAHEDFIYRLPEQFDDVSLAPLLCAGIIGYRAFRRTELSAGGRLGIYGFGGSAHLTAQIALAEGARVHVITRSATSRDLARTLGVTSVGDENNSPPEPLDGAILFAPVGSLVPTALAALDRGGVLAVAGIYLSDIPSLNYEDDLFQERTLRSVTANTRQDGREFLELAAQFNVKSTVHAYPFDQADRALSDLAHQRFSGAAVLVNFDR
ncbi:MAG TPA: zinc-dependent alcohol dehydrogenase family protein [Acidimicrobiales bacterium]|nr:zinc-dependent alcohol dehydrogenase family protein [Acidimicrobiales bacterium]